MEYWTGTLARVHGSPISYARVVDDLLCDHGLPQAIVVTVHCHCTVHCFGLFLLGQGDHSKNFLPLALFYQTPPTWLKDIGLDGWLMRLYCQFSFPFPWAWQFSDSLIILVPRYLNSSLDNQLAYYAYSLLCIKDPFEHISKNRKFQNTFRPPYFIKADCHRIPGI